MWEAEYPNSKGREIFQIEDYLDECRGDDLKVSEICKI